MRKTPVFFSFRDYVSGKATNKNVKGWSKSTLGWDGEEPETCKAEKKPELWVRQRLRLSHTQCPNRVFSRPWARLEFRQVIRAAVVPSEVTSE